MMASASWLVHQIKIALIILILQEGRRHSTLPCQFAIPTIQSSLELSPSCCIEFFVIAFIVNIGPLVICVISCVVVSLVISSKKINPVLIFCQLIDIINISSYFYIILHIIIVV